MARCTCVETATRSSQGSSASGRRGKGNVAAPQWDRPRSTEWPTASRCGHRHGLVGDVESPTLGVRRSTIEWSSGRDRTITGRVGWCSTSLADTRSWRCSSYGAYLRYPPPSLSACSAELDFDRAAASPRSGTVRSEFPAAGSESRSRSPPPASRLVMSRPRLHLARGPTPEASPGDERQVLGRRLSAAAHWLALCLRRGW